MKPIFLTILGAFLFCTNAKAQPISIDEAIAIGMQNNLNVKMADKDIEAAKWKVKEYKTVGLPQAGADINFQGFIDIPTTLIPAQAFNPMAPADEFMPVKFGTNFRVDAAITVTQLLFDGSYISGLKAAKLYPVISQHQQEMAIRDLKYDIKSAYFTAVAAKESIAILQEIRDTTASLQKKTRLLIEAGLTDSTNYDQLSLNVLTLDNAINKTKRNYQLALQLLRLQMGVDLNSTYEPNLSLNALLRSLPAAQFNEEFSPNSLLEHKIIETQISLLELQKQITLNKRLPSAGAFFSYQQMAMRNNLNFFESGTWFPATIAGFKITIPIFSSGQLKAAVSQNEIDVLKTQDFLEITDRNLLLRANQARINYTSALEGMITERKNLELAEKILRRSLIRYKEGVLSSLQLTQVQTQYLTAQSGYVMAAMELLNARVELDKSLNQ